MALLGIKCPYCGKSDRIGSLKLRKELKGDLSNADLERYQVLWRSLAKGDAALGVCKFCLNSFKDRPGLGSGRAVA